MGNCIITRRKYTSGGSSGSFLDGEGTAASPYLIKNLADWNILRTFTAEGELDNSNLHYRLNNNISVSSLLGADNYPFTGIFDGNGYTINENINVNNIGTGLFNRIKSCTIQNLKVIGTVNTGNYEQCGGLIGYVTDNSPVIIKNCEIAVAFPSVSKYSGGFCGGIADTSSKDITLQNCLFSGSVTNGQTFGCFGGWMHATIKIINCLENSSTLNAAMINPFGINYSGYSGVYTITNSYYNHAPSGSYSYASGVDVSIDPANRIDASSMSAANIVAGLNGQSGTTWTVDSVTGKPALTLFAS